MVSPELEKPKCPLQTSPSTTSRGQALFPKRNGIERMAEAAPSASLRLHGVQTELSVSYETLSLSLANKGRTLLQG